MVVKLVVGGPFSAGKTTFVTTVAERALVTTEVATSDREASHKDSTTVGMDFGVVRVGSGERPVELHIVGTPGQERFREVREVLAVGTDVFVLLVDGAEPQTWDAARDHHEVLAATGAPGVLAVNRPDDDRLHAVAEALGDLGCPVIGCDVRHLDDVKAALIAALLRLRGRAEAPRGGS